jgi:hypothetical protein
MWTNACYEDTGNDDNDPVNSPELDGIREASLELDGVHEGKSAGLFDLDGTANGSDCSLDFDITANSNAEDSLARMAQRIGWPAKLPSLRHPKNRIGRSSVVRYRIRRIYTS